ncbi:Serine phosphatase RsbU, regulator of sigma subunit [Alkalispirochaeta americana]|uniref:Serine phosphatase RsbU, regulator of sigma subunit n=1 Tax=Alkalispirochaeta americana TaxID=159291 RepID=A0A1N6QUS3_9SPIO|nr:GAF domain-containing SpoIIE family protein phosphatase [Alkalispirochaeta americana]SIQ20370.1 Serine phosphatase RsbU, regulator of sigma subunit [Alkalispirochaeta americana]
MVNNITVSSAGVLFFFSLSLVAIFVFFSRICNREDVRPLILAALIILLRDGIIWFAPLSPPVRKLFLVWGMTGGFLCLIVWTGLYRRTNRTLWTAIGVTLGVGLLCLLFPSGIYRRSFFLPPILAGLAGIALFRVDRYNLASAQDVEDMRPYLGTALVVSAVSLLLWPLASGRFQIALLLAGTAPFWTAGVALFPSSVRAFQREVRFQQQNTDYIFDFMSKIGDLRERDTHLILPPALETILRATHADCGAVVTEVEGELRIRAVHGFFPPPVPIPDIVKTKPLALRNYLEQIPLGFATPLWGEVLKTGTPLLIPEARKNPALAVHAEDRVLHLRSFMTLPLVINQRVSGLVSIARRDNPQLFNRADLSRAQSMVNFVALAMENYEAYARLLKARRLERDLEIASTIQESFLAPADVSASGADIAAVCRPVRGVGGDYYDIVSLDGDRVALIVGDVAGKGVPAALVMMIVRTAARLALEETCDAGEVLRMINAAVSGSVGEDRFATVGIVIINTARGEAVVASAGHHPLLLVSPEGRVQGEFDVEGLPVGIEPNVRYPSRTISFPAGSWGILYTDGFLEAVNRQGDEFGLQRLIEAVQNEAEALVEAGRSGARAVLNGVVSSVSAFAEGTPAQDDMTMIVFRG